MCYFLHNPGLVSMLLPLLLFSYFMIKEGTPNYTIWKISLLYVSFLVIFKFILCLDGITFNGVQVFSKDSSSPYDALFSDGRSLFYEGLLFGLVFI